MTVANISLNQVAQADVKVLFGVVKEPLLLDGPATLVSGNTYTVKFTAPAAQPDPNVKDYAPILLVGKAKQRVVSQQGKKFSYP